MTEDLTRKVQGMADDLARHDAECGRRWEEQFNHNARVDRALRWASYGVVVAAALLVACAAARIAGLPL